MKSASFAAFLLRAAAALALLAGATPCAGQVALPEECDPGVQNCAPYVSVAPSGGSSTLSTMVHIYWADDFGLVGGSRSITVGGTEMSGSFTFDTVTASGGRLYEAESVAPVDLPADGSDVVVTAYICNVQSYCSTQAATIRYESPPQVYPRVDAVAWPQGEPGLALFTVRSTAPRPVTYSLAAICDPPVGQCSPSRGQITLAPGDSATVAVNYLLTAGGIGSVGLEVTNPMGMWYANSMVIGTAPAPAAGAVRDRQDLTLLDRSLCVTVSVGAGAAYECGDLRLAHALPTTRVMNAGRTPVLIYNSQHAQPYPIVAAHVPRDPEMPTPDSLSATLTVENVVVARGTWRGFPGDTARIALGYDASARATGVYGYQLNVTAHYPGAAPAPLYSRQGRLTVVNRADSYFGRGWWLAGLERIVPVGDEDLLWVGGDGSTRLYHRTYDETGWYGPYFDRPDTIRPDGAGGYVRRLPGGSAVYFDFAGLHRRTVDPAGRTTTFSYAVNPQTQALQLSTLQLPAGGRTYTFSYTGGSPAAGPGRLAEVIAPGYGTGPDSARVVRLELSGPDVVRIWDPQYRRDVPVGSAYNAARPHVTFATSGGRVSARINRVGVTEVFRYDAAGLLAASALALAPGDSAKLAFRSAQSQGISAIVAQSGVYTWMDGPRTDVPDTTRFYLDRWEAPVKVVDALGRATTLRRGSLRLAGVVTSVTDAAGRQVTATYDDAGNLTSTTDWSVPGIGGAYPTTTYTYDRTWNRPTAVTLPEGEVQLTGYNAFGAPAWVQSGPDARRRVYFSYYPLSAASPKSGLVQSVTYPAATTGGTPSTETYDYDLQVGNLASVTGPRGNRTEVHTDAVGRVTATRAPLAWNTYLLIDQNTAHDTTEYDINGRVRWRDSWGAAWGGAPELRVHTESSYDDEGRPLTLSVSGFPDNTHVGTQVTTWRYDAVGRVVAEVSPDGVRDSTEYDLAGNPRIRVTRRGHSITMTYDALNRVLTRSVPAVPYTARYAGIPAHYGPGYATCTGSVSELFRSYPSRATDAACGYLAPGEQASFTYDPLTGRLATANNGDVQVARTYNPDGSLLTETQKIRTVTGSDFTKHVYQLQYAYDLDGRLRSVQHPAQLSTGAASTRYAYDHDTGQLSQVTDALGNVFQLTYNDLGAVATLQRPGGVTDTFGYNIEGSVASLATSGGRRTYLLDHDPMGRVTQVLGGGARDTVAFAYSGLGQVTSTASVIYGSGADPAFRGSETYAYDALGNQAGSSTSVSVPCFCINGQPPAIHTTLTSGAPGYAAPSGRLTSSTDWSRAPYGSSGTRDVTRQQQWSYDVAGNLEFSSQVYGSTGSCDTQTAAEGDCDDRASFYAADGRLAAAERRTRQGTDNQGRWEVTFEEYRYDALGRRAWVRTRVGCGGTNGVGAPASCQSTLRRTVWDGNAELFEIQMPGEDGSAYLENDTQPVPVRVYTAYWPTTGSPQPYPTNFFEWDPNAAWGRVGYTHGGGIDQPLGMLRLGLQRYWPGNFTAGQATSFAPFAMSILWDWRGQSDVVLDVTGANNHCQTFSGTQRCVFVQGQRNSWQTYELGTIYTKAAGWNGTLLDGKRDGTGTLYRRARYYDPQTGRFTQQDPIGLGGGINLYGFAGGDPVNYSDPSGKCPSCVGAIAGAVIGAVAGGAIYYYNTPPGQRSWKAGLLYAGVGAVGGAVIGGTLGMALAAEPAVEGPVEEAIERVGQAVPGELEVAADATEKAAELIPPNGQKLAQMIGRWGGQGGRDGFMEYARGFTQQAKDAGTVAVGQVGELAQATVYRVGNSYLVVDAYGMMRSYVHVATRADGIVAVYQALGGR